MSKLPGWQLGTKGAEVEVRVFYDLECPDSLDAHNVWKQLLTEPSPIEGQTYHDFVSLIVNPFVLPYHVHSFQSTQIIPYLFDLCEADYSQCLMDKYAELCWANLDTTLTQTDVSEVDWEDQWTTKVASELSLNKDDLMALYSSNDSHNTNSRVREMWKYSAANGISATPQAFVNGVLLEEYPESVDEWKEFFNSLYPSSDEQYVQ